MSICREWLNTTKNFFNKDRYGAGPVGFYTWSRNKNGAVKKLFILQSISCDTVCCLLEACSILMYIISMCYFEQKL